MCESHVSNPQTVGKCCSLLNSLSPPLPRSLISLDCSPGERPAPLQPCAGVCACKCVCLCACLPASQHTGSERRGSASKAPPGSAASCRQFLRQHQALHNTLTQATSARRQDQPRRPEKDGGCSFPLFLCMFISVSRLLLSASSSRTQTDIFFLCVHCFHCFEDPELRQHSEFL